MTAAIVLLAKLKKNKGSLVFLNKKINIIFVMQIINPEIPVPVKNNSI
jgi:hypothetical protein